MNAWRQINDEQFFRLFAEQYSVLNDDEKARFDKHSVSPWKALIRRSEEAGDEQVLVVAQTKDGVLYFDDVEYGFNISGIDENRRVTTPGGSQNTLKEAVIEWFKVEEWVREPDTPQI